MTADVSAKVRQALGLHQQGRLPEAEALYREILQADPRHFDVLHYLGIAAGQRGDAATAVELFDKAIAVNPDDATPYGNRGVALQELGRHAEALASFERVLALQPDDAEALNRRGVLLAYLLRLDEALGSFDRALAVQPDHVEALTNRGLALHKLARFEEALASFDGALVLQPANADALYLRGNTLMALKNPAGALVSYDRALALRPDHADTLTNRGIALHHLKRFEDALASFDRALSLGPDSRDLLGHWLHIKMKMCDWSGLSAAFERLATDIAAGKPVAPPFVIMGTPLPLSLQRRCAETLIRDKFPSSPGLPLGQPREGHDRIRLGYFSADFCDHPVACLSAGLFEHHDRARFELIGFSFGPPVRDAMRRRIEGAFDRFIDVRMRPDAEVARLARELGVDIAVDLMGFTQDSRTGIFARRAAPVQVNYLGYTGTMGADFIDYLIADRTVIPREHFGYYAERIAHLPHSFQANDSQKVIAGRQFTRAEAGLPEQGFVFCCFNNNWKITSEVFDIWMRLLERVAGSVLWLFEDNPAAGRNLRAEAEKRGVAAGRLVFAPRMNQPEHLARHRLADLFLDTLPYNAATTASDALWAGLPVLTRLGETFTGRVAASVLRAVGLPEMITHSAPAYEALALDLATDQSRLAALRQRLADHRLTQPLFDTALYTRYIEGAYAAMWQRHRAGLVPEHIVIAP